MALVRSHPPDVEPVGSALVGRLLEAGQPPPVGWGVELGEVEEDRHDPRCGEAGSPRSSALKCDVGDCQVAAGGELRQLAAGEAHVVRCPGDHRSKKAGSVMLW